jgi:hypothetical protein
MSLAKSSSLNLYDSLNKELYSTSTFSDRVEHNSGSKPQHFHGSAVKFYNNDGTGAVSDVVVELNYLKAGQVSDRVYTDTSASTEQVARIAGDASVNDLANTASTNRANADYTLQNTVTTNKAAVVAALASALASHSASDTELKALVDAEKNTFSSASASLRADLTAESVRAVAAEQKESADSLAADASLRADLTAESVRAVAAEQKESADSLAADASLLSRIDQRILDRIALVQVERSRIDAILSDNSVDLNKLKEIVDAYNALDTKQATQISTLTSTCALLQTQVTTLKNKIDLALTFSSSGHSPMGKK